MEQHALGETGAVDVHETVVVDIRRRHTHAVRLDVDPGLFRDIREMQRALAVRSNAQVVAIEAILERTFRREQRILGRLSLAEHLALHQVEVEVAVGFALRDDAGGAAHRGMLSLLRRAFNSYTPVTIEYDRTGPRNGTIVRVYQA